MPESEDVIKKQKGGACRKVTGACLKEHLMGTAGIGVPNHIHSAVLDDSPEHKLNGPESTLL